MNDRELAYFEMEESYREFYAALHFFEVDGVTRRRDAGTESGDDADRPAWYPTTLRGWLRLCGENLDAICADRRQRLIA